MSRRRKFANPLSAALLLCVTLPPTAHAQAVHVQERWSTKGGGEIGDFGFIAGMVESADGSIWIADNLGRDRIVALKADGTGSGIVARGGRGPGEVAGPTLMTRTPEGGVGIYGVQRGTIDLFDENGRYQQRVQLSSMVINPKGFAALPGGDFVVSGGIPQNPSALHRFDRSGDLVESWYDIPKTENAWAGCHGGGRSDLRISRRVHAVLSGSATPHRSLRRG